MTSEEQLRARLRKIEALFAGAATPGERLAAEAALARIKGRLAEAGRTAAAIELHFSIADPWSRQLFLALARRYGLRPYRYPRQRRTPVHPWRTTYRCGRHHPPSLGIRPGNS